MTATYRKALTMLLSSILLSLSALIHAGSPVWTFTPLTATSISVPANSTATIQYQVTNQSAKSHSLVMTPITGITQTTTGAGICSNPFTLPSIGSSCTLSLQVHGSQLTHSITDGPIVCEQGSALQCYKPSPSNVLNINAGANEYTINGAVSGLSGSVVLQNNGGDDLSVPSGATSFQFATPVAFGGSYNVTVLQQPTGQTCTVNNGSGSNVMADVTNVSVTCTSAPITLNYDTGTFSDFTSFSDLSAPYYPLSVVANGTDIGGFFTAFTADGEYSAATGFDGNGPGNIQLVYDIPNAGYRNIQFDYRATWYNFGVLDRTFKVIVQPSGGGAILQEFLILTAPGESSNLDSTPQDASVDISAFANLPLRIIFDWFVPQSFTGPAAFQLNNIHIT